MREDEKAELVKWLSNEVKLIESTRGEIPFGLDHDGEMAIKGIHVALAALTAEPVGEVIDVGGALLVEWETCLQDGSQLYTTPPAPSVPTEPVSRGYTLPDGFKVVPVVPTVEMYNAWVDCRLGFYEEYAAALAAAPAPPEVT